MTDSGHSCTCFKNLDHDGVIAVAPDDLCRDHRHDIDWKFLLVDGEPTCVPENTVLSGLRPDVKPKSEYQPSYAEEASFYGNEARLPKAEVNLEYETKSIFAERKSKRHIRSLAKELDDYRKCDNCGVNTFRWTRVPDKESVYWYFLWEIGLLIPVPVAMQH